MEELKAGWKTTEFWGKNLTQVLALIAWALGFFHLQLDAEQQISLTKAILAVIGGVETIYSISRGLAKQRR